MTVEANAGQAGGDGANANAGNAGNAGGNANADGGAQGNGAGQGGKQANQGGQQSQTIVDGQAGGDQQQQGQQQAPADWPADWRAKFAGDDKKVLEQLGRYGSPIDVWKKARALEQRLSSGELKADSPFPKDGSDEQKAAWRTDNGVPDKPESYKVELANGMVVGEADKPVVEAFTKRAHELNWTPAQVNGALQFYYETQDREQQQLAQQDGEYRTKSDDALRGEWGNDYRRNINLLNNAIAALPDGLGELLIHGRLKDGRMIGADPRVIKWLLASELERNPTATLVPAGADQGATVAGRLEEIRKLRRENPDQYDADKALQAEELKLIEANIALAKRGKAA